MSRQFSVEVLPGAGVAVVAPRGELDALNAPDLRARLLACLADQPVGIVVDVTNLVIADEIGLTVLAGMAQQSQRWPGARIALAGGSEQVAEAADRMGVTR